MGLKKLGRLLFVAENLRGRIEILLAAIVAAHVEASINHRTAGNGVGYSKRDSVPVKQIPPNMVEIVFAEHHPAILRIFPHGNVSRARRGLAGIMDCMMLAGWNEQRQFHVSFVWLAVDSYPHLPVGNHGDCQLQARSNHRSSGSSSENLGE
jgi:hypothetical protein